MPPNFWPQIWRDFAREVVNYVPMMLAAVLLLVVFWLIAAGVDRLLRRFGSTRLVESDALSIIARMIKVSLWLIGLVTALGTLGVNVAAMVAGLGLTGFAVGFALKDIISNALAGVLILMYQPFRRADRVSVFSNILLEGEVIHIDLRYTTLQLDDRRILIPNSLLFTNAITVHRAAGPAGEAAANASASKP